MNMMTYPMKFAVKAVGPAGIQSAWMTQAQNFDHEIPVSIPPEFDGPGTGLSPEDLYAMALQNCFIATFKVFAEKSKLQYNSINVESVLEVDRDEKGRPWMARIHMQITLAGVSQQENAKRILEKTSQSCMILNSVNTQKTFQFDFVP
jgi:peroxiredoxin-like protein